MKTSPTMCLIKSIHFVEAILLNNQIANQNRQRFSVSQLSNFETLEISTFQLETKKNNGYHVLYVDTPTQYAREHVVQCSINQEKVQKKPVEANVHEYDEARIRNSTSSIPKL